MTTSFNVAPYAFFTRFASSSGTFTNANRRWAEMVRLNGVRGAGVMGRAGGVSTSCPPRKRSRT